MNRNKQFAEHNKTGLIVAVIKLLVKDIYIGVQQNSEGGKIANIKDALTLITRRIRQDNMWRDQYNKMSGRK